MIDLLTLSIAIGLVVSLIVAEKLGRAAGGLIVPGYLAFHLTRPVDVGLTLVAALATYAVVLGLSNVMIVYGKRRTVLMILFGFAIGALLRMSVGATMTIHQPEHGPADFTVIGYIIPGLIAIWCDRQGVLDTCSATLTAAVVVRLILVLLVASQLRLYELDHREPPTPAAVQIQQQQQPVSMNDARRWTTALTTTTTLLR